MAGKLKAGRAGGLTPITPRIFDYLTNVPHDAASAAGFQEFSNTPGKMAEIDKFPT